MKQILVVGYPNDWHWVLTLEYANSQDFKELEVWDMSWIGEKGLKNFIKKLLGGNRFQRDCKSWLRSNNIRVRTVNVSNFQRKTIRATCKDIISQIDVIDPQSHTTIYNTLVEKTGTLRVNTKSFKKLIQKELATSFETHFALSLFDSVPADQIVTVNGRFTKNATVKEWADLRNTERKLLEFGSTREKFEIFNLSPHSVSELSQKINNHWKSVDFVEREVKAKQYLDAMKANKVSTIEWRKKIRDNYIPSHPTGKKICVFFASTEVEHAGAGDRVPIDSFGTQDSAFLGLVQSLPADQWHLYVRRHPRNPLNPAHDDPESELWDQFRYLTNVTIIEPDSPVDSISLGMSSDLVSNYWSTIAIELILQGHPNVVTLGPAPWNPLLEEFALTNRNKISEYLAIIHKPIQPAQIYPWAYFQATFGNDFQVFKFNQNVQKWDFRDEVL
jgi:hypothetical protein